MGNKLYQIYQIALSPQLLGPSTNLVCSVLCEANMNKFHFNELLIKIELKMQKDRITKYKVHGHIDQAGLPRK